MTAQKSARLDESTVSTSSASASTRADPRALNRANEAAAKLSSKEVECMEIDLALYLLFANKKKYSSDADVVKNLQAVSQRPGRPENTSRILLHSQSVRLTTREERCTF